MYNSKLIQIFEKLTKPERIGFKKWVASTYANPREDVTQLVEFILSKRAITPATVKKTEAWSAIFPNKTYNETILRYIMSYATQCLEEFLAYHNWKQADIQPATMLTKIYNHRNLNHLATKQLEITQNILNSSPQKDSQYYAQKLDIEIEQYNLLSKNKRYENFNLQEISDTIHHYAIAEILRYACVAQSFRQVSGKTTNFLLLENILMLIQNGNYEQQAVIQIYYLLYLLSNKADDDNFNKLYHLVFKHETAFKEDELKDIFLLTINYCIKQLNTGRRDYAQHAFTLYIHALDKQYLLENGELSRFTFKNIAFIGIKRLQNYKQTEQFIEKYSHYINENYRENAIQFTTATLFYAQKKYTKAMHIFQQVEFADVLWNVDAKILMIKMLFEQKEYETIPYQIKNAKMYIYRSKDIGYFKPIHKKTMRYFDILYKTLNTGKLKKNQIIEVIKQEKDLAEKEWFLQQL